MDTVYFELKWVLVNQCHGFSQRLDACLAGGFVVHGVDVLVKRLSSQRAIVADLNEGVEKDFDIDDAGGEGKLAAGDHSLQLRLKSGLLPLVWRGFPLCILMQRLTFYGDNFFLGLLMNIHCDTAAAPDPRPVVVRLSSLECNVHRTGFSGVLLEYLSRRYQGLSIMRSCD